MIHRCRHHLAKAMPVRGDGARDVDQMHHAPAKNIPQQVGVLWQHKLGHFRARSADWPAWRFLSWRAFQSSVGWFHDWIRLPRKFGVRSPGEYTMRSTMTQPQKKTRRQMLEEFVAAKPNDAFARYGLAMDCANSGDSAAADEHFKALLGSHPEYVAGYFQY